MRDEYACIDTPPRGEVGISLVTTGQPVASAINLTPCVGYIARFLRDERRRKPVVQPSYVPQTSVSIFSVAMLRR